MLLVLMLLLVRSIAHDVTAHCGDIMGVNPAGTRPPQRVHRPIFTQLKPKPLPATQINSNNAFSKRPSQCFMMLALRSRPALALKVCQLQPCSLISAMQHPRALTGTLSDPV